MKKYIITIITLLVAVCNGFAQLSPYDANEPIGWCTLGNGITGDETNTVYHVTTYDEMKDAFKKIDGKIENRTIYFDADIYVPTKFFVGQAKNLTLYGKPGTKLYNNIHSTVQDESGIFYFKECENLIIRNIVMECAGAFDNSSADNMQLVTCKNVWVDHCDFLDGVDGCLDIKTGSDNISITWCRFRYLLPFWPDGKRSYIWRHNCFLQSRRQAHRVSLMGQYRQNLGCRHGNADWRTLNRTYRMGKFRYV